MAAAAGKGVEYKKKFMGFPHARDTEAARTRLTPGAAATAPGFNNQKNAKALAAHAQRPCQTSATGGPRGGNAAPRGAAGMPSPRRLHAMR
ncbi:hypothetical protein SDC9_137838 [bioreactor metagenome]|uniref:Uncharacterized protein n=1 Tax=bioreactor metagenome TaxID=1076179 RepID=A0A645DN48_9ZZZZ